MELGGERTARFFGHGVWGSTEPSTQLSRI
jgi:hypothetical protein